MGVVRIMWYVYILDLENIATASRQCIGVVIKLGGQLVDYTYDGRVCRGSWMHKVFFYIVTL